MCKNFQRLLRWKFFTLKQRKERESSMSVVEICFAAFNIVAVLDIVLIMKNLYGLNMSIRWNRFWILLVVFYGASLAMTYLEIHEKVQAYTSMWVTYGFLYFIALVCSKKHRIFNLLMVFPAVITYGEWTQLIALFEHLFGLDKYYIYIQADKITPLYFFQDASLLAILLYLEIKGVKEEYRTSITWLEGIFITVSCIFFFAIVGFLDMIDEKMESPLFSICWVIIIVAANAAVVYAIAHRKKARYYGNLSKNYRRQLEDEYKYFKEYKNKNQDIAKFRHDWNNHAMVLQEMLHQGKVEEASLYFEKLYSNTVRPVHKVITGDEIVDMVLSIKQGILEEEHIQVIYEGKPVDLSFMEHVDICTVFSNLVDNAIESCRQVTGDRYLRIKVTRNEHLLLVVLENSKKEQGEILTRELPETTKENKKEHGFGLKNVQEIVKKYSGEMKVEQQKDTFAVRLLFPREDR